MTTKALEGEFHSKYITSLCSALLVLYRCTFLHVLHSERKVLPDLKVTRVPIRTALKNENEFSGMFIFKYKEGS